ncbi:hypothetical protein [Amnibacterium sp.]|uniref:hypothetical protein n=1 Tax=Amnibacterium sp. TaxID=1872496 RepID=UPI003F7CC751
MTAGSAALLVAIVALVAVAFTFPAVLVLARTRVRTGGRLPQGLLLLALGCGVVLVGAVATIVAVVVLT